MSIVSQLVKSQTIRVPSYVESNTIYEVIHGSRAYGTHREDSDYDIYGICIPSKHIIFPHLGGVFYGFDDNYEKFHQYQEHDITFNKKKYELQIFNIVQFFYLCGIKCAPNQIDSLYVPINCVISSTPIGEMIRSSRELFLSKKCWHTFKGYAYSQLHKAKSHNREGKRKEIVEKFGFDTKFAAHTIRLLDEVEQILSTGHIDLQRSAEEQKAIIRGEVPFADIEAKFQDKERYLEQLYQNSSISYSPRRDELRQLLLNCIEHHYGSINAIETDKYRLALTQIDKIIRENL